MSLLLWPHGDLILSYMMVPFLLVEEFDKWLVCRFFSTSIGTDDNRTLKHFVEAAPPPDCR